MAWNRKGERIHHSGAAPVSRWEAGHADASGAAPVGLNVSAHRKRTHYSALYRRLGALAVAGLPLVLNGCDEGGVASAPAASVPVLSERTFTQAASASAAAGESCDVHGSSGCTSGLCLRISVGPEMRAAHVCSALCSSAAQCPRAWECSSLSPGEDSVCTPPEGWTPPGFASRPQSR